MISPRRKLHETARTSQEQSQSVGKTRADTPLPAPARRMMPQRWVFPHQQTIHGRSATRSGFPERTPPVCASTERQERPTPVSPNARTMHSPARLHAVGWWPRREKPIPITLDTPFDRLPVESRHPLPVHRHFLGGFPIGSDPCPTVRPVPGVAAGEKYPPSNVKSECKQSPSVRRLTDFRSSYVIHFRSIVIFVGGFLSEVTLPRT